MARSKARHRTAGGLISPEIRAGVALVGDDGPELFIPVADDAGQIVGVVTPQQAAVIAVSAAPLAPVLPAGFVVRARESFGDILTHRDYRPGDIVPWDRARAERYAARGVVEIIEDGVSE